MRHVAAMSPPPFSYNYLWIETIELRWAEGSPASGGVQSADRGGHQMTSMRNLTASAAVVLSTLATPALAQSPPKPAPAPPPARWAKTPSEGQLRQMRASAGVKAGARAIVRCHVDHAGALSVCATVAETPAGSGYGQALAALAPAY